jgi:hypothetical protein
VVNEKGLQAEPDLFHIAGAIGGPAFLLNFVEDWQRDAREDRDDCDHDEQFDEGECGTFHGFRGCPVEAVANNVEREFRSVERSIEGGHPKGCLTDSHARSADFVAKTSFIPG